MDQSEHNNPAGRLHAILSRAMEYTKKPDVPASASQVWGSVFDIHVPADPIPGPMLFEIVSRLIQLDKLIEDTETSLLKIEGLSEKYFRPFARIRNLPRQSLRALNSDILGSLKQISEGDMTVLEFCSEKLQEQHTERIVDEMELQNILEDLNALFNDVQQSEMDSALQTFILDGLESIRRGIYEFRIRGPQRLKETLAEIIGTMIVNHDVIHTARNQDSESVGKFEKLFYRLAAAVSFANDGPALLSAARALLPGGA